MVSLSVAATALFVSQRTTSDTVTVVAEPLDDAGAAPFTESLVTVGNELAASFAARIAGRNENSSGATSSGVQLSEVGGDGDGLYGGSTRAPVCDVDRLARALAANDDLAAAWALAAGTTGSDLGATLAVLTPVVLTRDTAVTNHAYVEGDVRPFQSILQAGTAALIDERGVPRVRCACGNPLRPPDITGQTVIVDGPTWDGFSPGSIVAVAAAPEPMTAISAVDIDTLETTEVPIAAPAPRPPTPLPEVELDGILVVDDVGVHVVSEDGAERATVVSERVRTAFDDRAGGLIYQAHRPGDDSIDAPFRPPSSDAAAPAVMHLAAGETVPVELIGADTTNWPVLEGIHTVDDVTWVVFTSMRSTGPGETIGDLTVADLATGDRRTVEEATTVRSDTDEFAGRGVSDLSSGGDRLIGRWGSYDHFGWLVYDADFEPVEIECFLADSIGCPVAGAVTENGSVVDLDDAVNGSPYLVAHDLVAGSITDSVEVRVALPALDGPMDFDVHDGRGLFSLLNAGSMALIDLATGEGTVLDVAGQGRLLRAPLVRPGSPDDGAGGSAPVPADLPPAVATLYEHLWEAAGEGVEAVAAIADEFPDLTYTLGTPHPDGAAGHLHDLAEAGIDPAATLRAVLERPHEAIDALFLWSIPRCEDDAGPGCPTGAGYSVTIAEDGTWVTFIEGE